jgi:hypothetical protein
MSKELRLLIFVSAVLIRAAKPLNAKLSSFRWVKKSK